MSWHLIESVRVSVDRLDFGLLVQTPVMAKADIYLGHPTDATSKHKLNYITLTYLNEPKLRAQFS